MRHNAAARQNADAGTDVFERKERARATASRGRGDLAPLIAAHAERNEQAREIAPEVLAALHEARLFRMLLPRSVGGWEADPTTFMQAIEELAKADASTAWCVAQASGCSMTAAYVVPEVAREIFGAADAVMAWGPPGADRQGGAGRGRLSRDRDVELRERDQARGLARLSLPAVRARRHAVSGRRRQTGRAHPADSEGAGRGHRHLARDRPQGHRQRHYAIADLFVPTAYTSRAKPRPTAARPARSIA